MDNYLNRRRSKFCLPLATARYEPIPMPILDEIK